MADNNLMHPPIMPIAPKSSQYGIDPSLVKRTARHVFVAADRAIP